MVLKLFVGTDRRLRPIVCALLYAALAFWLLSADWVLGPVLERVASALGVRGWEILRAALAWLGACILVGVAEELLFRGYLLQTLWKSLGLWPAAILIAAWFAADHYFFKQGENVWDVITLVTVGLWACYSVLRTGTLWLAVGYHASFDYMQLFVIGTKNGSVAPVNHLLDASFQGPAWVTGGVLGTEASLLMYPSLAPLFLYTWWRFGRERMQPA